MQDIQNLHLVAVRYKFQSHAGSIEARLYDHQQRRDTRRPDLAASEFEALDK